MTAGALGSRQNGATFPTATVRPENAACKVAPPPPVQNEWLKVLVACSVTLKDGGEAPSSPV